ncbi:MAG: N-terminal acetyltransferase [Phylliscum demangeonii]|nr:MAG: N-terminal acetyltransferase [Phylliscum demangeonii]
MSSASRPIYSSAQLDRYFARIKFKQTRISEHDAKGPNGMAYLSSLLKYQQAAVPFENLDLHYAKNHGVSLEPQDLYHKIVERGHGGYCFEINLFFGIVLRTLGYQIYLAGARVSAAEGEQAGDCYQSWNHMVIIATLNGSKYLVDVGFGANAPTRPMPLVDGVMCNGVWPQSQRLQWTNLPENTDSSQRLCVLQYRNSDDLPWLFAYCFHQLEWLPQDFAMLNYAVSTQKTSFMTYRLFCVQTILEEETVVGVIILAGEIIKRRYKGRAEVLMTCGSERQRVEALEKWFDIRLTAEEQRGIKGMVSEIHRSTTLAGRAGIAEVADIKSAER